MVDKMLRFVQARAFRRGMRGYNSAWVVVGIAFWMINRARSHDEVIYRTRLKPGEQLFVRASAPPSSRPTDG